MLFSSLIRKYEILDFPYPFHAMLAINSDVEWTNWTILQSLIRTFSEIDLECAFSYWMFAGGGKTWRLFDDNVQPTLYFDIAVEMMRDGIIDTNHSFGGRRHAGGVYFSRNEILRGYDLLEKSGVKAPIYTNHGSEADTQNIAGKWGKYQLGDIPGSEIYHLDRTLEHGVRFFWTDIDYVVDKSFLSARFTGQSSLFRIEKCRDGNTLICFKRYLGHLQTGPSADNLDQQLDNIGHSTDRGYCIIYQHLGVHRDKQGKPRSASEPVLSRTALNQLRRLAQLQQNRQLLVTTTCKLLNHALLMAVRPWKIRRTYDGLNIHFSRRVRYSGIELEFDTVNLIGWGIRVPSDWNVTAYLGAAPLMLERTEHIDGVVYSIPWTRISMENALGKAMLAG